VAGPQGGVVIVRTRQIQYSVNRQALGCFLLYYTGQGNTFGVKNDLSF
jgi:hypothetical protein